MKRILSVLALMLFISFTACEKLDPAEDPTENESGNGNGTGTGGGGGGTPGTGSGGGPAYNGGTAPTGNYWVRNDGVRITYLSLVGTVAKTCANGVETIGTYNSSEPSMKFVIQGNTIIFPLKFEGGFLYLGVPNQALYTNNETQYKKTNTYTCSSGNGGGGTTPTPANGSAIFWTNLKKTGYNYNIYLKVKGFEQLSYITATHAAAPECNAAGAAKFGLEPGSYSWRAEGYKWHASGTPTKTSWAGTITITSNGCSRMELK